MNIEIALRNALQNSSALNLQDAWTLERIQENAFELRAGISSFFVKWIAEDDEYGQNEIRINQEVLAGNALPVPCFVEVLKAGNARVAIWEWMDGIDLRQSGRQHLIEAFERLGKFHKAHRHHGLVYSFVTHQPFASIKELLDADWNSFNATCEIPRSVYRSHLAPLETGYPTIIHGDMHPGNLRLTDKGIHFVDWGFARSSLNLFDLDYVYSVALDSDPEWWIIQPGEAAGVLSAYYRYCGMDGANQNKLQYSVMIHTELFSLFNATRHNNQEAAERCRIHLEALCD